MNEQMNKILTFSGKHQSYLSDVMKTILSHYSTNLIGLGVYGSYARRDNTKRSDLDILIILKKAPCRRERLNDFITNIEMKLEAEAQQLFEKETILCELSPFILIKTEALNFQTIYCDMTDHLIITYDPEQLLERIVAATKKLLLGSNAKKVRRNNSWEWQLNRYLGEEAL